jgi:hypothetical protein
MIGGDQLDIGLFFLGVLGAIVVLYLSKQTVIPEFRPLYDTFAKEEELARHQDHIKITEKDIDDNQKELKKEDLKNDQAERLKKVLDTSLSELNIERSREHTLEREIMIGQIITRSLGFLIYVILGGVFGALLAGYVKVEGLSGDLPKAFESIVIGATWTTYLSTIGLKGIIKNSEEQYNAEIKKMTEEKEKLIKVVDSLQETSKKTRGTRSLEQTPPDEDKVFADIRSKINVFSENMKNEMDRGRQISKRNLSGF